MSTIIQGDQLREIALGRGPESKASGAISGDPTINLFTVAGGEVLVTALWLKVTTLISTDGGTLALQNDPTTGDTVTIVGATDLGTTNSAAGSLIGVDTNTADPATTGATFTRVFVKGGPVLLNVPVTTGTVDLVGAASVNGAVTVYCTWVPLVAGATLVAA